MDTQYFIRKPEVIPVAQLTADNRSEVIALISQTYPNVQDDGTTISYNNGFFGSSIEEGDYFRTNGNLARWQHSSELYSSVTAANQRYLTEDDV